LQEISDFKKMQNEKFEELKMKKSRERIEKLHLIHLANSQLPKTESQNYKENKKNYEDTVNKPKKIKEEKHIKYLKVKNFGKIIKENLIPSINEAKKKEREDKLYKAKVEYHKRKRNPHNKYIVKIKKKQNQSNLGGLNLSNISYVESEGRPHSAKSKNRKKYFLNNYDVTNNRPLSADINNEDSLINNKSHLHKNSSSKNVNKKRVPLEKLPNYLENMKNERQLNKKMSTLSVKRKNIDGTTDNADTKSECILFLLIF